MKVGVTQGTLIIFGIFSSIITARYLGPEGSGLLVGLLVYPSLFTTFGSLGIKQSATYFIGKNIFSETQIKTAVTQIWFLSSLISIVCSFLLMYYLSNSAKNLYWVLFALIPIPFTLFNTYNSGIFLGKNDIKSYNKINWIPSLLSFFFLIVLVVIYTLGVSGVLLSKIGGVLFMFIFLLINNKFIKSFSLKFNWSIIKQMLSLGLIYAFALLIINLNYKIDIVLLDKLSSSYELGIYSKGAAITQYLWQIPMLFGTVVFSRSSTSKNGNHFSLKVAQLLRVSLIFIGLGSIMLLIFSDFIIVNMYGYDFSKSAIVLNYLLPGVVILTIYKVMNMDLAGKGKPWISLKAMIPSLFINLILNIYLIPIYGAVGAAFSSTISYSFAAILFLHFYSLEVKIPIMKIFNFNIKDYKQLFDLIKKIR
ncbi:polysaccharide biosynthesis C-terminal domain-containing protein [Croceibacter atlanticus]|uniref:oligosaccharide flippase family protein n=1 Tax=Croceibacter atlanticus TaxID=313588 RepID=UPI002E0FD959|nr:polysaccharide biosynthesis C-terminal domain-containing protein [Croceibacter atlanticus]